MARKKKTEETIKEIKVEKEIPEFYILKIGETLKEVANRYNLNEKDLIELNGDVIGTNQIKLK